MRTLDDLCYVIGLGVVLLFILAAVVGSMAALLEAVGLPICGR